MSGAGLIDKELRSRHAWGILCLKWLPWQGIVMKGRKWNTAFH